MRAYNVGSLRQKQTSCKAHWIGAAAEIDDHLNRGRNMDTRTPQEQCAFVV
jgi:hypothetical protein